MILENKLNIIDPVEIEKYVEMNIVV
jgi:hypothetical protein